MRVDRELACEAVALSHAGRQETKPYGRTIIKLLENFGDSLRAPGLARIVEDKQQMQQRILMIAQFQKPRRRFGLAGLLFVGLPLLTLTDARLGYKSSALAGQNESTATTEEQQQLKKAAQGDKWAACWLWDAYHRGSHGIQADPAKADEWLRKFIRNVWVVRFEPVGDYKPTNPGEFLERIHQYAHSYSGKTDIGEASFFRTTVQGDKLAASFLSNVPDQLKAHLAKVPGVKVTLVAKMTPEEFVKYEATPQESLPVAEASATSQGASTSAKASALPPKIVSTSPAVGATDVDPALAEITVTFDQDMGRGMSWTGGGPDFPASPEGQRARWRDKRTCVLPVKLEAGHYYRVGINSSSHQNFASQAGVPALPSAIFFTTQGASEELKAKVLVPKIVRFEPENGARDISPNLDEVRVTFDVPMGGGFSWCTAGDDDSDFPKSPEGKRAYWTKDQKTCVLPVALKPGVTYRISLNAPEFQNFQSEAGVPLVPEAYSFTTAKTQ